jgi:hypothetical protein
VNTFLRCRSWHHSHFSSMCFMRPKPVRASMLRQAELSQCALIFTGTPSSLNTFCANRASESPAYTA